MSIIEWLRSPEGTFWAQEHHRPLGVFASIKEDRVRCGETGHCVQDCPEGSGSFRRFSDRELRYDWHSVSCVCDDCLDSDLAF